MTRYFVGMTQRLPPCTNLRRQQATPSRFSTNFNPNKVAGHCFFSPGRAGHAEFSSDIASQACLADGHQPPGPRSFFPGGAASAGRPTFWHPGTLGGPFRLPGTVKPRKNQTDGTNFTFVPSRCLHGASSVAKLHFVQVNADRRDDDTWLIWLSPLPRLTGSSGAGKLRALRSVPTTRCS